MADKKDKNLTNQEEKSTLDYAMDLVRRKGKNYHDWKLKSLGLQFVLLGMAETQSERLFLLTETTRRLEEIVFKEETLRQMEPAEVFKLYKTATDALKDITDYIRTTVDKVDWPKIEADLITLRAKTQVSDSGSIPADMSALAEFLAKNVKSLGMEVEEPEKKLIGDTDENE